MWWKGIKLKNLLTEFAPKKSAQNKLNVIKYIFVRDVNYTMFNCVFMFIKIIKVV